MALFQNFPLIAAICAIIFAQFVKIPIAFFTTRKWDWSLFNSTGGMPSSHSAAVTALTTGVALEEGMGSTLFAVSAVLAIIVMYDSSGVRRQTGEQAIAINQLMKDFQRMVLEPKQHKPLKELKEVLGHKPIEVFFGGLTGIMLTLFLHIFV
ncbi:divergent PAP2 family protein [Bacillus litorisediminis]|uniref:divergent PAP2 family protein n=1 Tax=Bacillus litorisediminis TaxID=2922713 RepID=UPI001FADEAD6|nr:divergent PAP2 family protein [Bacillus litorisediminis]